jgi:hypothetical protein
MSQIASQIRNFSTPIRTRHNHYTHRPRRHHRRCSHSSNRTYPRLHPPYILQRTQPPQPPPPQPPSPPSWSVSLDPRSPPVPEPLVRGDPARPHEVRPVLGEGVGHVGLVVPAVAEFEEVFLAYLLTSFSITSGQCEGLYARFHTGTCRPLRVERRESPQGTQP